MTSLILLRDWREIELICEIWKPIEGFKGYDVSNLGRVRTWIRNTKGKPIRKGKLFAENPTLLSTMHADGCGYPYVSIYSDTAKRCCPKVHKLVANAFLPNPDNLPEVNHVTGLKGDNRIGCLERITRLGNIRHAIAVGLKHPKRTYGDERPHASMRISDTDAREMQRLYWEEDVKPAVLAEMFNTTYGNAQDLVYGLRKRGKRLMEGHDYGSGERRSCGRGGWSKSNLEKYRKEKPNVST